MRSINQYTFCIKESPILSTSKIAPRYHEPFKDKEAHPPHKLIEMNISVCIYLFTGNSKGP